MCIILSFAISIGVKITVKMVSLYALYEFLLCLNQVKRRNSSAQTALG